MPAPTPSAQRFIRRLGCTSIAVVGLACLAQAGIAFSLSNEITPVESAIVIQGRRLAAGLGFYPDLNSYPYTVYPYGPIFYGASGVAAKLDLPAYLGGRLLSFTAFLAAVALTGSIVKRLTGDPWAAAASAVLSAGTANLLKWGTTGQSDVMALALGLAGFERYTAWRESRRTSHLFWAGALAALAVFTKQSLVASAAAIAVLTLAHDRKQGLAFGALLVGCGVAMAFTIDGLTGGYFDHGVRANLNPFSWEKFAGQAEYFLLLATPLLLIAFAPAVSEGARFLSGAHVYLLLAFAVLCGTAAKLGADLNYQIEVFAALCIACGLALHRLDFFNRCFRSDTGWITLLQLPLLFYLALNVALTGRTAIERVIRNQEYSEETLKLEKYLTQRGGRVLSVEFNPLVASHLGIEVEPLIYTLCVNDGLTDPAPVIEDLRRGAFSSVILYQNVFTSGQSTLAGEVPSLPRDHLNAIRESYRLVEHVDGPLAGGVYVYQPAPSSAPSHDRPQS